MARLAWRDMSQSPLSRVINSNEDPNEFEARILEVAIPFESGHQFQLHRRRVQRVGVLGVAIPFESGHQFQR